VGKLLKVQQTIAKKGSPAAQILVKDKDKQKDVNTFVNLPAVSLSRARARTHAHSRYLPSLPPQLPPSPSPSPCPLPVLLFLSSANYTRKGWDGATRIVTHQRRF